MAMALLPTVRLLPLTSCRTTAPTSSPLSVRRPRPRALSIPRVHFCASRTPQAPAAAREAAAFWAGKLAGAVPWKAAFSGVLAVAVSTCLVGLANARTGVNKPELLPKEFTTVIDVSGFLSSGQENRLRQEIEDLEKDTGYKLRVLAQNYPDTHDGEENVGDQELFDDQQDQHEFVNQDDNGYEDFPEDY